MTELILIVDDEPELVRPLEFAFRREGFETRVAHDGRTALAQAAALPRPDLVLLDLMLPDISGTEVCRRLRADAETQDIPVIMVTARGEEIDRVVGFEVGADDYVVKPFSTRELVLRARAVLRRRSGSAPDEPVAEITSFGRLRVDDAGHRAWVDGEEVQLTALEFRLLTTFLERKGRVQSRDTLLDTVWGVSSAVTTRTVDTHVKRLRQKLGAAGGYVQTIRGVGYRFRANPEDGRS
jgi:two-component system, OmpR family, phosphate regulon response regulator PhoB